MSGKSRRRRASVAIAVTVLGGLGITLVTSGCSGPGRAAAEASPAVTHHFQGSSAAVPVATATASLSESGLIGFAAGELLSSDPSSQLQQLEQMKSMGMTTVRVDANWLTGEPDQGHFDWSTLDAIMASVRHVGMTADLIIDGCPPWAAAQGATGQFAQPASPKQFGAWAAAVAARYGPMGADYFEVWNEPNTTAFWTPKPEPGRLHRRLLKAAYPAIKGADSTATVLTGGTAPAPSDGTPRSPRSTSSRASTPTAAAASSTPLAHHPYCFPADPGNDPGLERLVSDVRHLAQPAQPHDRQRRQRQEDLGHRVRRPHRRPSPTPSKPPSLPRPSPPPRTPAGSGPSTSTPGATRTAERASACSTPTVSPSPPTTPSPPWLPEPGACSAAWMLLPSLATFSAGKVTSCVSCEIGHRLCDHYE